MIPFVFRNDHSTCYTQIRLEEGKNGHREASREAIALVQKRYHGHLDQWGDSSDEEKWTDLRYIFEGEVRLLGCKEQKMNG